MLPRRLSLLFLPLLAALVMVPLTTAQETAEPPKNPVIEHCLVGVKQQVRLSAREPGVLVALESREGMEVKADSLLARIDDSQPQIERRIKTFELAVEKEQALNDINIRYNIAATDVAKAEYDKNMFANTKVPGSVPAVELNRLRLMWHKAKLQIEQAQFEQKIAKLKAETKQADVEGSILNIQRREVKAPFDGLVVETFREVGEWVPSGEPVLRMLRLDRVRVKGSLAAAEYGPEEVIGKPVKVEVQLAHGRKAFADGKVVFVSPELQLDGSYEIWADVANRTQGGQYVLRPGQSATMTINISQPPPPRQATLRR